MKKTVMIFGVSSFLGSNLLEALRDDYRVIGTYHQTPVSIPGITCVPCDVLKKDYVSNLVAIFKPDITLYAVGMSSLKDCHLNPSYSDALNSAGAVNCCVASERLGSKFVYFSSGYVMGGEDLVYREGDTPFPETAYGNSLSSTEFYIQRSCLNYLIFRCSPLYGRSYHPLRSNWFETTLTSLTKNDHVFADESVVTGFLDVQLLTKILKATLDKGATNRLFHVSSKDFMSRYEFALACARVFKKEENLIQKVSGLFPIDSKKRLGNNKTTNENKAYYFRLDTSNLEEFLGVEMPRIEDSLRATLHRLSNH